MGIMNNAGELNTAEKGFSRRNFLMGAASAGALAVLGLSGCAPKGKDELSDTGASATGADVNWDEETEVLVVGSGYAGLAAVYEAAKAGAAVRVIEKHKMAGGNSVYADGQIAVVGSAAQKAAGIEDSIETFMNDALTAGLNLNYKDKLQLVGEKSNEVFEWTVSEIGVEWAQDEATVAEGCSDFDPDTASSTTNVKTTRGVVLATGGYGKDVTFRSAQDPRLDETVGCTNFDGATAHGLRVALDARRHGHAAGPDPVLSLHEPRGGLLRLRRHLDRGRERLRAHHRPHHRQALRQRAHRPQALLRRHVRGGHAARADRLGGQRARLVRREPGKRAERGRGHRWRTRRLPSGLQRHPRLPRERPHRRPAGGRAGARGLRQTPQRRAFNPSGRCAGQP